MAGVSSRVLNGGNLVGFWTIDDTVATPTVGSTYAYKLSGNIISTSCERQDTGAYNVTIEHVEDDATLQAFIASSITVGATTEALTFEDGTQEGASGANAKYICAVRGGFKGGDATAARKVGVFPVRMMSTSGGWSQSGDTYNRVKLEFEGFKLEKAVTLASTYFTDFMKTASPVTLTTSVPYGTVVFS